MNISTRFRTARERIAVCAILSLSLLAAGGIATLTGCGGGSDTPAMVTRTTPVVFAINWAARSRAIGGPASALSAVVVLKGAAADGTDLTISPAINRDAANLAAYTQNITSANVAKVGTFPLHVEFHAQTNGAGDLVGVADASVTLASDGSGIGDIATVGRVASVAVNAGQSVSVGVTGALNFTAKDGGGNILALTPGSAQFGVTGGGDKLQVSPSGAVTGVVVGSAQVTATVDGKVSSPQTVTVAYVGGGTLQGISVQNNDGTTAALQAVAGSLPTDGTAPAPAVDGSSTQAVRGGNVLASVRTTGKADSILVGVEGQPDFYRVNVSGSGRGAAVPLASLAGRDQSACGAACGGIGKKYPTVSVRPVGSATTRDAGGTTYNVVIFLPIDYVGTTFTILIVTETGGTRSIVARLPITINGTAQASGKLQFTMTWGQPVDLDLHVMTPDGDEIGFDHRNGTSGGDLDLDSNAACTIDNVDNENITWTTTDPKAGTYVIRPDYWSACESTVPIPYTIRVNKNGAINTFQGTFQPSEVDRNSGTNVAHNISISVP